VLDEVAAAEAVHQPHAHARPAARERAAAMRWPVSSWAKM
jgi:hypothetical protein